MQVDLTSFNGVEPLDNPPKPNGNFTSHQRGMTNALKPDGKTPNPAILNDIWRQEVLPLPNQLVTKAMVKNPGDKCVFPYVLTHSLGFLNRQFGDLSLGTAYGAPNSAVPSRPHLQ